jgi:hypothetical protein
VTRAKSPSSGVDHDRWSGDEAKLLERFVGWVRHVHAVANAAA